MGEALTCAVPVMVSGIFTPKVTISKDSIRNVENEFQGRPFNRNAFWNVLTRDTRTTLNLELKSQTKIPEDMLYKGVVLFFENHLQNRENYHLRTSTYHVVYVAEGSEAATVKSTCDNQDKSITAIDTDRLIFSTDEEAKLSCYINNGSDNFSLQLYKNHLIIRNGRERAVFVRAEIIRNDDSLEIKIRAMDPDQRSLVLTLSKNMDEFKKRKVALQFYGKTTMFSGNGSCRSF